MNILIRTERPEDPATIRDITQRAFAPMPFSGGYEHDLIDNLRAGGALAISLVAELGGVAVGQVTFSPAFAADGSTGWYALGPIAVDPAHQKKGIGRKLIEGGIVKLRESDAAGCVLVGNPDRYRRFGFRTFPQFAPPGQPAEYFQILPLRATEPGCVVDFHPLFRG